MDERRSEKKEGGDGGDGGAERAKEEVKTREEEGGRGHGAPGGGMY